MAWNTWNAWIAARSSKKRTSSAGGTSQTRSVYLGARLERLCLLHFAPSLHSAVDLFPVSYLYHQDEESFVPNLIDGSVVLPRSNGDAIELLHRLHLLPSLRTWILFQADKVQVHLLADVSIELANVPLSGGGVTSTR